MSFSFHTTLAGLLVLLMCPAGWAQYSGDPVVPSQPDRALRLGALGALLELPYVLPLSTSVAPASSAAPAGPAPSMQDIARASLDHSLEVDVARQRLASFGFVRDAARGALLPHADMRLGDGRGRLTSVDPAVILPRREVTVTLRQPLIDEPARNELQRQRKLVMSSEEQLENVISTTVLESANAFLAAMQASIGVRLGTEYERLLAELLRYIGERADAGGASKADLQRVRARVANIRTAQADSGAALKVALRNLIRLTGTVPAEVQLGLITNGFVLPDNADLATVLARRANHELLAARIEAEAVQSERDGQRARFLPRMELELSHTRVVNGAGLETLTRDSKAMVIMTIPLLNGGADLAQVRAAGAHLQEMDAKAGNVERKLTQEIDTAYANLDAADQRFRSVRDELDANTAVVAAFRAQMVGSNRSLLEVLDAYQRLHQSRLDLTQVLVSEAQNQLRVAHLTGTLVPLLAPVNTLSPAMPALPTPTPTPTTSALPSLSPITTAPVSSLVLALAPSLTSTSASAWSSLSDRRPARAAPLTLMLTRYFTQPLI